MTNLVNKKKQYCTNIRTNISDIPKSALQCYFDKRLAEAIDDPLLDRLFIDMPCDEEWTQHIITTLNFSCTKH